MLGTSLITDRLSGHSLPPFVFLSVCVMPSERAALTSTSGVSARWQHRTFNSMFVYIIYYVIPVPIWHLFQACERTCIRWYWSNFVLPQFIAWTRCKVFSTLGEDSFVHMQLVLVPSSSEFMANTQSLRKFHVVWHTTYSRLHAFRHPLPARLVVDGKVWSCAGKVVLLQSRTTYIKSLSDFFNYRVGQPRICSSIHMLWECGAPQRLLGRCHCIGLSDCHPTTPMLADMSSKTLVTFHRTCWLIGGPTVKVILM